MTREEIDQVELHYSIKLPASYREVLLAYPFPDDSFGPDCMLIDEEISADERQMAEIRNGAKWWEFWKKL